MKRKRVVNIHLRDIMGDEGKNPWRGVYREEIESSNSGNYTDDDDMDWESLLSSIVNARMSVSGSSLSSSSNSSSDSISTYNNNVPLIPDEKKKGILTNPVKPLSKFSNNRKNRQIGESSCGYCVICGDAKPVRLTTVRGPCTHRCCVECFRVYVASKIQENASLGIDCPETDCKTKLSSDYWRKYVPEEVYERKRFAFLEGRCLASPETIKCPYCRIEFLDDKRFFLIRACTNCWTVICIMCMVRWHLGISCREFQAQRLLERRYAILRDESWNDQGCCGWVDDDHI